jgi:predicted DNA-binding transcriptional regulator AlpA
MKNTRAAERLVDAKTIALEMLGISKRGFWRLRAQGKIGPKPVKVGGSLRWRLSEIVRWIQWDCCDASEYQARLEAENAK